MSKAGKAEKWAARSERLRAALRENLKRRKAQARGRAGARASGDDSPQDAGKIEPKAPDFRRNRGSE
jgi:hypothetical protein